MALSLNDAIAQNHRAWERHLDLIKQTIFEELNNYIPPHRSKELREISIEGIIKNLNSMTQNIPFDIGIATDIEMMARHFVALAVGVAGDSKIRGIEEAGKSFSEGIKPGQPLYRAFEKLKESVRKEEKIRFEKRLHRVIRLKAKLEKERSIARRYAPNKKYPEELILFFETESSRLHSQKQAYDAIVSKYGLDPLNIDSFLRQYRRRKNIPRNSTDMKKRK